MTKEDIREILMKGAKGDYSHMIVYSDHWDYSSSFMYVEDGDDIENVIASILSYGSPGMYSIDEIYNYSLDLESQLDEERANHKEPLRLQKRDVTDISKLGGDFGSDVRKAIDYAVSMHDGQTRFGGEPYVVHPIEVMYLVDHFKNSKMRDTLLISACLHDVIEDTKGTFYDIVSLFGAQVASIVLELTTDEDMKEALGKEKYLKIKMKNMSSWALVIKLCDRLNNVSDLGVLDSNYRDHKADETMGIIEFLLVERSELSRTHLNIIKAITETLKKYYSVGTERYIKLVKIEKQIAEKLAAFDQYKEKIKGLMYRINLLDKKLES